MTKIQRFIDAAGRVENWRASNVKQAFDLPAKKLQISFGLNPHYFVDEKYVNEILSADELSELNRWAYEFFKEFLAVDAAKEGLERQQRTAATTAAVEGLTPWEPA